MPEGPSLIIAKEEMIPFIGKKVLSVTGNSKIDKERIVSKKLIDIKTWGKHLLFCFNDFALRIHFLMFGKYLVNAKKDTVPRLSLKFSKGEINLYTCAIKVIEEPLDEVYDWTSDVLNDQWDPKKAKKKLLINPDMLVTDALLDQTLFSGVGNIIKNEVLYRIKVHPKNTISALPARKLNEMIREARNYSFDFLKWKKEYTLRKHWLVHTKKICERDGSKIVKEYLGKTNRRTFFCNTCQKIYQG
jgi:endonuclease-8